MYDRYQIEQKRWMQLWKIVGHLRLRGAVKNEPIEFGHMVRSLEIHYTKYTRVG